MTTPYLAFTDADVLAEIADQIVSNERTLLSLDINADIRSDVLAALPAGAAPDGVDEMTAQKYRWRDSLHVSATQAVMERFKVQTAHDVLVARIPADQLKTLIAAAKAKQAA